MELEEAGALIFLFSRLRKRRKKRRFWVHPIFGIMRNKWRIFHRPMNVNISISILIRKAEEQVQQYQFVTSLTSLTATKVNCHGNIVPFDFFYALLKNCYF
jgi:hypothetical protein